ncbi:MAG: flagellin FliC [Pseudomonadales bacterium]|nr:flagellin FliC [Pseudomonadales bacterium]
MTINVGNSISPGILTKPSLQLNQAMERLASGKRINSSGDDAAGSAVVARMTARISGFDSAIRNTNDGISYAQVGDAALGGVQDSLQRIRELSVQAANGILNDKDRSSIQAEVSALKEQITSVFDQTSFNGKKLLGSGDSVVFQVGPDSGQTISASTSDLKASFTAAGFDNIDVSTAAGASSALSIVDSAIDVTSVARSDFGALQNRLVTVNESLQQNRQSAESTRSQIEDADYAAESSKLANNQIQQQAAIAMLAQANANKKSVLQLLN